MFFIRHGDPDYINDTLTEKGRREAALLGENVGYLNLDKADFYVSPLGRAQDTAMYGKAAITGWKRSQRQLLSVSELVAEERQQGVAYFRAARLGDIANLRIGGEEPSFMGRFCEVYSNQEQRH